VSISPGARLGPYEIVAAIGAGGMGEVYRARDTRLDRTVAIKVLPASFAADADRRERFTREAKAISSLDHPHICTLYDIGEHAGTAFLVMQYLEGETIEQRLIRGALPTADALRHAIEIAEALDRAHRHGVVHRDLKPGNIMLTRGGAKVLDFGLAKVSASSIAGAGASAIPTTPPAITAQGTILGTFQYMAPEQLEGADADHRSDIFAFGSVLYEMLTGKRAFEGRSQASLISAIMSGTPAPLTSLQPLTPPALERIVMKCLEKDPDRRWQSAADLADELRWATSSGSTAASSTLGAAPAVTAAASRVRRARALWAAVAILGVALLAVTSLWLRDRWSSRSEPARSISFMTTLPDGWVLAPSQASGSASAPIAVSPDGQRIAIIALGQSGPARKTQIWIRSLDALVATPLTGTEGASSPFWSPDGRNIGFFADGQLKKIDARGGPVVTLCPADGSLGASWGKSGTIVFTPTGNSVLMKVPETGGVPVAATKFGAGEIMHWRPSFLPDGRHFIYRAAIVGQRGPFYVASIDSTDSKLVLQADSSNAVYSKGHLLFLLGPTLMAQRFDLESLTVSGGPFPIADRIESQSAVSVPNGLFSVSDSGLLAYRTGSGIAGSELVWFDRSGKRLSKVGEPARYTDLELSPDGKRLAVAIREGAAAASYDVWIIDLERNVRSRFTSDPADEGGARWTADGKLIAYYIAKKGLFIKPSRSSSSERRVIDGDLGPYPDSWTPDQRALLYELNDEKTSWDIWVLPVFPEGKPRPLIQAPERQEFGRISPDGRWIAYRSTESGREEIFVVPYPGPGDRVQVSSTGGKFPRWRRDGRELFYMNSDNRMMVVGVDGSGQMFRAGAETALFDTMPIGANWPYDVTADGQRFLISSRAEQASSTPITVVVDWTAALK
jgi:serine/threonine protein kinase/dipeptidyl aminopeptidase/acylaminoacyl peptidase